ncbi:MAG: hypothetical protein AAGF01_02320 [Cyanobacteria bacterium P01_G01_bin.38]
MKSLHYFVSASSLAVATALLTVLSAQAQTPPPPRSIPDTVINGTLVNNASREFFEAGRERLEAEIRTLREGELAQLEPLLTVREDARDLPEDALEEWVEP